MANPHRGDIAVGRFKLKMSVDAICELEELTGKSMMQLAIEMKGDVAAIRMALVRQMMFVALKHHHPEITLEKAGEVILSAGGQIEAINRFAEALAAAMPAPKEGAPAPGPRKRTR